MSRIPANQSEIWCYGRSRINQTGNALHPQAPADVLQGRASGNAFEPYEGKLSRTVPLGGKPDEGAYLS